LESGVAVQVQLGDVKIFTDPDPAPAPNEAVPADNE
jgi:hypothetical protein